MFNRLSPIALMVMGLTSSAILLNVTSAQAQSAPIDERAYADGVVSYERGESNNWNSYFGEANSSDIWQVYDPNSALGVANWTSEMTSSGSLGQWNRDIGVSLGRGGILELEFTNNYLAGSGNEESDLWIFEIGGIAEKTFVEISMDGQTWYDVGVADRQDRNIDTGVGLDIDNLLNSRDELNSDSLFSFVRITDTGENKYKNFKAGADIDAVAALSSVDKEDPVTDVPEPGLMVALGLVGGSFVVRRRFG
ncbi:MAG: PEP-CTERM sorting domain-containing protein [Leptolyngbyaceae cyanobacterium MO_188.B28]|nr:PEP-CTERM sorting domain-containing protein [Leptolyngbyaceae cyanobacterium MO_188.B28]